MALLTASTALSLQPYLLSNLDFVTESFTLIAGNGNFLDQSNPFSQSVQGCTDPTANNYNPSATCDDGSCCYSAPVIDVTQYTWNWEIDWDFPNSRDS